MERIKQIIKELKIRNYENFNEFYQLTSKIVFFIIIDIVKRKEIAEDLLQDTYIKFLDSIDMVDEKNNPQSYLMTIAKNLAINYYNKSRREIIDEDYINNKLEEKEESKIDLGIIDYLNGIEKEIVMLHIVSNYKFKDIAKIVKKPLGTVLWIYNKAIKYLRKKVGVRNEK